MAASRFDWYERVRISTAEPAKTVINDHLGAVLGKAEDENGCWSYGVYVYQQRRVWLCREDELVSTGEFDRRESLFL